MSYKNLITSILCIFVIFSVLLIDIKVSYAQNAWSEFTRITGFERGASSIGDPVNIYINSNIQGTSDCGQLSNYRLVLNRRNDNASLIEGLITSAINEGKQVSFRYGGCIQLQRDATTQPQPFYPLISEVRQQ